MLEINLLENNLKFPLNLLENISLKKQIILKIKEILTIQRKNIFNFIDFININKLSVINNNNNSATLTNNNNNINDSFDIYQNEFPEYIINCIKNKILNSNNYFSIYLLINILFNNYNKLSSQNIDDIKSILFENFELMLLILLENY